MSEEKAFCEIHGEYTYVKLPFAFSAHCPKCLEIETMEKEKEEKLEKERREAIPLSNVEMDKLGIMPRHYHATFENFIVGTKYQQNALDAVKDLHNGKNKQLVLCGGNGCGKTHLLSALLKKEKKGMIIKMTEASLWIRNPKPLNELEVRNLLKTSEVLVIDEIGRSNNSEFEQNWLSDVIDYRWGHDLKTVLIGNYPLKEMVSDSYHGQLMDDVFGLDILSRLKDFKKVRISGEDLRGKK
jgi:DNA replication protein DnaC